MYSVLNTTDEMFTPLTLSLKFNEQVYESRPQSRCEVEYTQTEHLRREKADIPFERIYFFGLCLLW